MLHKNRNIYTYSVTKIYICIIYANTYLWFHIKITFLLNLIIFWFTNPTICNDINFVLIHSPVLCLRKVSYIFVELEDRQFLGEIKLQQILYYFCSIPSK